MLLFRHEIGVNDAVQIVTQCSMVRKCASQIVWRFL